MDINVEDEMKKITDSLGRSTVRPKAPGAGNGAPPVTPTKTMLDRLSEIRGRVAEFDADIRNELDRLSEIRGRVAEFDADIRNDIAELDADLAAMYVNISTKIGTR